MKRLFFSISLVLFSAVMVFAQETVKETAVIEQGNDVQDEKVEIKTDELPEAVRTTLSTEEYKDWTIEKAYHIKTNNYYEVKLKKGSESKSIKFDKDGNVV